MVGFFESVLDRGLSLRTKVTGRSMSPFLRGGEVLTIRRVPVSSLRRGDLILYKNLHGCPVVHRLVKRKRVDEGKSMFLTKGDALFSLDEPLADSEILGKVCRIETGLRSVGMETTRWVVMNYLYAVYALVELRLHRSLRVVKNFFV